MSQDAPYPYIDNIALIKPGLIEEIEGLQIAGPCAVRRLPGGRILVLAPLLFGRSQLCLGRPAEMAADGQFGGWDEQWDYEFPSSALGAMATWNPDRDPEPSGWIRHPASGRRRAHGDPARETVRA